VIAALTGIPVDIRIDGKVLLECGLVTLVLAMPPSQALALTPGQPAQVHTHLHFSSQADQLKLFGFSSASSRDLFMAMIGVSGIGPAAALSLLELGTAGLVGAIRGHDERALTSVPGVGPKLAKKVILELEDKVARDFAGLEGVAGRSGGSMSPGAEEALSAVTALGFPRQRAEQALSQALGDEPQSDTVALIRRMLALLGRG
jgi:Holliday junction DNA helicase RuvA